MKLITIIFYFFLAIIIFAAIGVIAPFIIDLNRNNTDTVLNLNKNIITYFIAILVTSSFDIILSLADKNVSYKKPAILGISFLNLIIISISVYLFLNEDKINVFSWCILFFTIIAWTFWWIANYHNPNFDVNVDAALGGNPNTRLRNG